MDVLAEMENENVELVAEHGIVSVVIDVSAIETLLMPNENLVMYVDLAISVARESAGMLVTVFLDVPIKKSAV